MRYHNILHDNMSNGEGLRVVLFVSGCNHHCPECHNPVTWNPDDGLLFDEKALAEICSELSHEYCTGLTLSGGDPLYPSNRDEILEIVKYAKTCYPNKTIWLYTGYSWEEIKELEIMKYVDVVVDGEFKKELADVRYHWAGSTNQRVIDVVMSLKRNEVVLYAEESNV